MCSTFTVGGRMWLSLIIVKEICPSPHCSGPLAVECHSCMHEHVCDGSSVPVCHTSVALTGADFNGFFNEMPRLN